MVDTSRLEALAATHRAEGLQLGSQVFVSIEGRPVVHFADGDAVSGRPLRTTTMLRWYEAAMPLMSILAGRLVEAGKLHLDEPVAKYVTDFANGKQTCTVRHLLTHMGGFAGAELADRDVDHETALAQICSYRAEYEPGTRAGFHPSSGWRVLAAVIEAVEGRDATKLVERRILKPLNIRGHVRPHLDERFIIEHGTELSPVHWCGYGVEAIDEEGNRYEVEHRRDLIHNTTWHASKWEPASSAWGSAAALGRIYEGLLGDATALFERPTTVDLLTTTHRSGVRDRTFRGAAVPWGLGFQVAGSFGGSVGHRVFGHSGLTGRAFCDPVERMVVVYLTNGLTSRLDHERRMADMTDAIYETLVPRSSGAWITTTLPAVGVG